MANNGKYTSLAIRVSVSVFVAASVAALGTHWITAHQQNVRNRMSHRDPDLDERFSTTPLTISEPYNMSPRTAAVPAFQASHPVTSSRKHSAGPNRYRESFVSRSTTQNQTAASRIQSETPSIQLMGVIGEDLLLTDDEQLLLPIAEPSETAEKYEGSGIDTINFTFHDAPWLVVLKTLADEAGLALELNEYPRTTFTYSDSRRHTLEESMDIVNGFLIHEGFILVRHGQLLILLSTAEDIPSHLIDIVSPEQLHSRGQYELVSVMVPVLHAAAEELETQMKDLLTPLGTITHVTSAKVLVVRDLKIRLEFLLQMVAKADKKAELNRREVVQLNNIKAEEAITALQQMLAAGRAPGVSGTASRTPSARGSVPIVAIPETNSVVINGTPNERARISSLLMEMDRSPAQVYIRVMLVEVELSNQDEFGVELGLQESLLFNRSIVDDVLTTTQTTTSPNGVQTTTENVISSQTSPGFNFNNQPPGNNTAANPGQLAGQVLSNLAVGRINTDLGHGGFVLSAGSESISILLRALSAKRKVNVLSRPTIRTVDNRVAMIQMGAQVPVVDGVSISTNGNANPVVRQDKSGIILEVTPKISKTGSIFIEARAEKSEFRSGPGSGVPIFVDATNGNVIESPIKDVVEVTATLSVMSGQTIVLGGMITKSNIEIRRKVPFAGDLPLVGHLFRYDLETEQRKELLVFLTPQIIYDEHTGQDITRRELERMPIDVSELNSMTGTSWQHARQSVRPDWLSYEPDVINQGDFPDIECAPVPPDWMSYEPAATRMPRRQKPRARSANNWFSRIRENPANTSGANRNGQVEQFLSPELSPRLSPGHTMPAEF
jgi:type II secretory pathway component GspD/PulD (secretin)